MLRSRLLLFLIVAWAQPGAAQQTTADPPAARGIHGRALLSGHGALGLLPEQPDSVLAGGGLSTGFDVALHPNHDVGLRAFLTFNTFRSSGPLWDSHTWAIIALAYRFHDDVVIDRVAPFIEVGAGYGMYGGCLRGDYCGGGGAAFDIAFGGEVGLHRYASMVFGAQLLLQSGLVNGLSVLIAPTLFVGVRAG